MRKYAFGDLSVPREETQYLKIKYPAKYPALSEVSKGKKHNRSMLLEDLGLGLYMRTSGGGGAGCVCICCLCAGY